MKIDGTYKLCQFFVISKGAHWLVKLHLETDYMYYTYLLLDALFDFYLAQYLKYYNCWTVGMLTDVVFLLQHGRIASRRVRRAATTCLRLTASSTIPPRKTSTTGQSYSCYCKVLVVLLIIYWFFRFIL